MKRKILKGAVVLATSAAAALAACSNDGAATDDTGGEGGAGGSDSDDSGATGGNAPATGGTTGEGGGGGEGGAPPGPPETDEEFVAAYCPGDADDYTIVSGTEETDEYAGTYVYTDTAYVSRGAADDVHIYGYSEASDTVKLCIIAGAGKDYIRVDGNAGTTANYPDSNFPTTFILGGPGADEFHYGAYMEGSGIERQPFTFADYEAEVDTIFINANSSQLETTVGVYGKLVSEVDFTSTSEPSVTTTYPKFVLVVDKTDGEIWLSRVNEGTEQNVLLGTLLGSDVDPDDVLVD